LDLSDDYGVHTTFNVTHLIPFVGSIDDEANNSDLRTNPFQEGGMMEEGQARPDY